ncbi:DUF3685 domain-containing protein [Coleofasciculus sp. FACHB-1120]|uniref:DUF3685 domain-containing protein n=1 Tax=Coleofasciculus sp. FACHB-1120 TaxID=2692783 RepID=UPI001687947F|nr:DUF3685 domain-containing protein [Coleofasciculus sp. FACHB-1120]MBD2744149.1 DUF3685 domain-containing protein [Coleofasciculus sp. FACHB-1120]
MSDRVADSLGTSRPFKLMLIDDDPIFRLGLSTALASFPELQVISQADSAATALEILAAGVGTDNAPNLVILELNLGRSNSSLGGSIGLQLCQEIKTQFPKLPIFLLSQRLTPPELTAARTLGVEGYCPKGTDLSVLVPALRQVASGEVYWSELVQTQNYAPVEASDVIEQSRSSLLLQMRQSGLRQIDTAIAQVTNQVQNPNLSTLDWFILTGRQRELRTARWLVNQLLPVAVTGTDFTQNFGENPNDFLNAPVSGSRDRRRGAPLPTPEPRRRNNPSLDSALTTQSSALSESSLLSPLLDATLNKLQFGLKNLTGSPLEIDILLEDKKRELLYLILRKFEEVLEELRLSQLQPEAIALKHSMILRDLWQASTTDFFGKYYTIQVGNLEVDIVNTLLQDETIIQQSFLDKIPLVADIINYLLFQTPLIIDNVSYSFGTPEARVRAEAILENLLIQIANSVVQPLLNYFADVEVIKQIFYDRRLMSSREIARFRNNLSWKYRLERYVGEPTAIFESRYLLLALGGIGIKKISIYAPRTHELQQLRGAQLACTLALETRDAIAPRLRSTVAFLGGGVVYVLTQVIGRGIGLIGRGIIQGIGTTLQETRFGKNSERQK